jgi:hypothetical protein
MPVDIIKELLFPAGPPPVPPPPPQAIKIKAKQLWLEIGGVQSENNTVWVSI